LLHAGAIETTHVAMPTPTPPPILRSPPDAVVEQLTPAEEATAASPWLIAVRGYRTDGEPGAKPRALRNDENAHVRVRDRLLSRIVDRAMQWSGSLDPERKRKSETWEEYRARRTAEAARQLAAYKWPTGWDDKLSRYETFGARQHVIGKYADVPTAIVHSIMCTQVPR